MTHPRFGLAAMAGEEARAEHRGATLRRLLRELGPYRASLTMAFVLIVIGAAAQAAGPWLVGRAIDDSIRGRDPAGLARTMLV
ncbi:MAG TPA: hypothetical protein VFJ96_04055, partial [Gemmatimonadaceae bacterium]|nr:hypothetical protein [Gemmatimonadaceae bacterium]